MQVSLSGSFGGGATANLGLGAISCGLPVDKADWGDRGPFVRLAGFPFAQVVATLRPQRPRHGRYGVWGGNHGRQSTRRS